MAQGTTAAQQRVAVADAGERADRELRELVAARARECIQLLDVVQRGGGRERRGDAAVDERIEGERVVGAGREAEGDVHARCDLRDRERGHARELRERVVEAPERAIGLLHLVRDHADLQHRNALVLAGGEDRESLHRLDADTRGTAHACARPDRQRQRLGQRAACGGEQLGGGSDRLAVAVAVDGLRADHRGQQGHSAVAAGPCDADVQHRGGSALRHRVLGGGVGLAWTNAADQRARSRCAAELLRGGRDHEQHVSTLGPRPGSGRRCGARIRPCRELDG